MMKNRKTLLLLLAWTVVMAGVYFAGQVRGGKAAGGQTQDTGTGGYTAAVKKKDSETGGNTDSSGKEGSGTGGYSAFFEKGDKQAEGSASRLCAEDVLWQGGLPAFDAASSTVYIPCGNAFAADAEDAGAADAEDEDAEGQAADGFAGEPADKADGTEASAERSLETPTELRDGSAFWDALLMELVPADPAGQIVLLPDEIQGSPAAAIREGHAFAARLEAPDGTVDFKIVLTGLPTVCIRKADAQEIVKKEEHSGQVRLIPLWEDEAAGGASQTFRCTFHVRGNVSSTLDKKPFKLSILDAKGRKEDVQWLDLRSDDDWILNPLYTDKTRVREMTAYELWEETEAFADAPTGTSRMRYAEVFIDDKYQGIYGLMEPVDRKQLGLSEGDLLYKIDRWNREYPYLEHYDEAEAAGETEIKNEAGFTCVELRYPGIWNRTATWKPMQAFHSFSFETFDTGTLAEAGLEPDMDSVLSLSLFCTMVHAEDNTWKNSFLIARKRASADGLSEDDSSGEAQYALYRTIWDLNYVFGDAFLYAPETRYTVFQPDTSGSITKYQDTTFDYEAFVAARPESAEAFREAVRQKWAAWRDGGISADSVISSARRHMDLLTQSGALAREMDRWPQEQDCGEAMEDMEQWIRSRFAFLDEYFSY